MVVVVVVAALVSSGCARLSTAARDQDHDGVKDDFDLCPAEPESRNGIDDWDGCPETAEQGPASAGVQPDLDGDGIAGADDRCPHAAEDRDRFEDNDGCPDPDNDKDRIVDAQDKCPNEPELYNGLDDDDGCPERYQPVEAPLVLPPGSPPANPVPPGLLTRFQRRVAELGDLEYGDLAKRLRLPDKPARRGLSFDVRRAKYYDLVTSELKMTSAEKKLLATAGVVSVDHRQRYGMGSAYYAIYSRDLPVLVTSDSILHAFHRSFDSVLQELETDLFSDIIAAVLESVHAELGRAGERARSGIVRQSLSDVDLYVTVARNLLAGAAALPDEKTDEKNAFVAVASVFGQEAAVQEHLDGIRSLRHVGPPGLPLRGGRREVDYSQFRPRGHYTGSVALRRYFRTMMWLGRSDLGFVLAPVRGVDADADRELRAAVVLVHLLEQGGARQRLQSMSDVIDFMIGGADDLSFQDMAAALARAPVGDLEELARGEKLAPIREALARALVNRSQIRSQVVHSSPESAQKTPPPGVLQLFAQRFGLDSFVLAQLVYDAVAVKADGQKRLMPLGLDVMAAFGNDQAVSLLRPEIDRFHYAANLLAARELVAGQKRADWDASLYAVWLDTLRTLDDEPARGALFPEAMRTRAWQHKQLQAQLASWAELRHDTLLYLKQSYTAAVICGYPSGYVEPYPALFARLRFLAAEAARRLRGADVAHPDPKRAQRRTFARDRPAQFFDEFAQRMGELEALARKELGGKPFTPAEAELLKRTINLHHGSGAPSYTGWYAQLFYAGDPQKWNPTVADVHTDVNSGNVLEEAVGDVTFLVVAVDNQKDRAVYVGPIYSHYELQVPMSNRMTDADWHRRIESGDLPPRPDWTRSFQPPGLKRTVDGPPRSSR
jgi:hypothetical protein